MEIFLLIIILKIGQTLKEVMNPLRIPAFGMSKENIEIYYIKPYKSGFYYYSPVDYQGGLQYAELRRRSKLTII